MGRRGEGVVIIIIQIVVVVVVVEWVRVEAWMKSSQSGVLLSMGWSNGGSGGRRIPQTATAVVAAAAAAVAAVAVAAAAATAVT